MVLVSLPATNVRPFQTPFTCLARIRGDQISSLSHFLGLFSCLFAQKPHMFYRRALALEPAGDVRSEPTPALKSRVVLEMTPDPFVFP